MKILLTSHRFSPDIGGIEEVSSLLAREFVRAGHEVRIVTQSVGECVDLDGYAITRRPNVSELIALVRWGDVVFQSNISLQTAWPLVFIRKPWVVVHHTWTQRTDGSRGLQDIFKMRALAFAENIAVSRAIAEHLPVAATIISNPYRDEEFRLLPETQRDRELIFVGRLVSDKGVDLLLQAMAELQGEGLHPRLTIVGSGPEEDELRRMSDRLGLTSQVCFEGARSSREIAALLNRHRILVVPSRWREPFGLVAIEAIACGCVPLVADCGGLPEAVGRCGRTFAHREVSALANALRSLLPSIDLGAYLVGAGEHLEGHRPRNVAARYLELLERVLRS